MLRLRLSEPMPWSRDWVTFIKVKWICFRLSSLAQMIKHAFLALPDWDHSVGSLLGLIKGVSWQVDRVTCNGQVIPNPVLNVTDGDCTSNTGRSLRAWQAIARTRNQSWYWSNLPSRDKTCLTSHEVLLSVLPNIPKAQEEKTFWYKIPLTISPLYFRLSIVSKREIGMKCQRSRGIFEN